MNKNEIITLTIGGITNEGCGLGKDDGFVVFVPYTAVGDVCEVRILKVLKNCAYGRIERIITPSPDRITPDCTSYGKCGGCAFRHISYEAELRAKARFVEDAFKRIGGLNPEFLPVIANTSVDGYRNKAQFVTGRSADSSYLCGFYAERSHRLMDASDCRLHPEAFKSICTFILAFCKENKISTYNEAEHNGVLRHIFIRRGYHSGEVCVCLIARRNVPEFARLAKKLAAEFPHIKSVVVNINKERTNGILGEKEILLYGEAHITDKMRGKTVRISPKSFYQVNTEMAEILYGKVRELAMPEGKNVVDLYCGAGTIGLSVHDCAKSVIGVEIVEKAIENAKENAALNSAENMRFICADAGEATDMLAAEGTKADVVVLDPARRGCDRRTLQNVVGFDPGRIVMVSCNPSTAARDCAVLEELGYRTVSVQGVDLFSRTVHVECVILLTKK